MYNYSYKENSTITSSPDKNKIETKNVTVQEKSSFHPYYNSGSSKGYFINGKESPSLTLRKNVVYRFDQSDSSNTNHRIQFFSDPNKINSYTTDVKYVGIPGSKGAYTEITLTSDTPLQIFYQ